MSLICATYLSLMCQTHISFYCLDSLKTSPWQFPELLAKRVSRIKLPGLSINIRLNLSVYRKMTRIWVSRFGGVLGCSIFSGTCFWYAIERPFLEGKSLTIPCARWKTSVRKWISRAVDQLLNTNSLNRDFWPKIVSFEPYAGVNSCVLCYRMARPIGASLLQVIFRQRSLFSQKGPIISGFLAESDPQLKASCGSSPPYIVGLLRPQRIVPWLHHSNTIMTVPLQHYHAPH